MSSIHKVATWFCFIPGLLLTLIALLSLVAAAAILSGIKAPANPEAGAGGMFLAAFFLLAMGFPGLMAFRTRKGRQRPWALVCALEFSAMALVIPFVLAEDLALSLLFFVFSLAGIWIFLVHYRRESVA